MRSPPACASAQAPAEQIRAGNTAIFAFALGVAFVFLVLAAQYESLTLPLAQPAWQLRQTSADVVAEIDALLDDHTEGEIARILNERGHVSGEGLPFHAFMVQRLRRDYQIKTRYNRLREDGMLTLDEIADLLGVSTKTVKIWRRRGLLLAHAYNDKNECLYEPPGDDPPVKKQGSRLSKRRRFPQVAPNPTKEVQCEA